MARTKGSKNKPKLTVKYLVVWGDPQCQLYDTMEEAKEQVRVLVDEDGEDSTYIYIFPVSEAFKVQTTVETTKVGINSVELE